MQGNPTTIQSQALDSDIKDREERIFAAIENVVDLMMTSPVPEVKAVHATVSVLLDEYSLVRESILAAA